MEANATKWLNMQALQIRRAKIVFGLLTSEFKQITKCFGISIFSVELR